MTLNDFIRRVKRGAVQCGAGGRQANGGLADGVQTLAAHDVDAVTAEAYNQHVFSSTMPWAKARQAVQRLLAQD